jgi:hypothetical protein
MSSRVAIQQFVSSTEPTGVALGDEWYVPSTGLLYKRTAIGGTQTNWVNLAVIPSGGTSTQVLTYGTNGALTWTTNATIIAGPLSGVVQITNTTNATSVSTGALQVSGGIAVGKDLYVGGTLTVAGTSGSDIDLGGGDISGVGRITANTGTFIITNISSTTASAGTTTGALTVIGGAGVGGDVYVGGIVNCTDVNTTSDMSLKDNVSTINNSRDILQNLRGVRFNWKESGQLSYGLIAQELEKTLPELVRINDSGLKSIRYLPLIGILLEAIKAQQAQIDQLIEKIK